MCDEDSNLEVGRYVCRIECECLKCVLVGRGREEGMVGWLLCREY